MAANAACQRQMIGTDAGKTGHGQTSIIAGYLKSLKIEATGPVGVPAFYRKHGKTPHARAYAQGGIFSHL